MGYQNKGYIMEQNEDTVVISRKEYDQLLRQAEILQKLEDAGVDNWEYYYLAFQDEEEEDE